MASSISHDDRRLDALGRLVEHEQLRPGHERPGDGQLLGLAAATAARPGGPASRAAPGTRRAASSMASGSPPRARSWTTWRFSAHGQAAGTPGGPGARSRCPRGPAGRRSACVMSSPSRRIAPRPRRQQAHHRVQQRRLADAVAAHQARRESPSATSSDTPNSDLGAPVGDVEVVDLELHGATSSALRPTAPPERSSRERPR